MARPFFIFSTEVVDCFQSTKLHRGFHTYYACSFCSLLFRNQVDSCYYALNCSDLELTGGRIVETNTILITLGLVWLVVYLIGYVTILIRTPSISLGIMLLIFPPLAAFWILMDKPKVFGGSLRWLWMMFALWSFVPVVVFLIMLMLKGSLDYVNPTNTSPSQ